MQLSLIDTRPAPAGRFAAVRAWLADTWRQWRARRWARDTAQALAELDDRTLRDLGFDRSELGAIGAELHGLCQASHRRITSTMHGL